MDFFHPTHFEERENCFKSVMQPLSDVGKIFIFYFDILWAISNPEVTQVRNLWSEFRHLCHIVLYGAYKFFRTKISPKRMGLLAACAILIFFEWNQCDLKLKKCQFLIQYYVFPWATMALSHDCKYVEILNILARFFLHFDNLTTCQRLKFENRPT